MSTIDQKTLKSRISCTGVGLHSGVGVRMTLHPAEPDTGIVFRRMDPAGGGASIRATAENISESILCTSLRNGDGIKVSTIEHLMAALAGCGIDNALVELDGAEVPIMDGSAAPFVFLIECAGFRGQSAPRRAIRILKEIEVRDGERAASFSPAERFSLSFEIDYANSVTVRQDCFFAFGFGAFKAEISRARTYGFVHEVEQLRALGLARGGSLDNAVVMSGDTVLNEGGLRYDDELVRHKILDSIGDLYLLGAPIIGHFHGARSGHALNHRLIRSLLADPKAWRYTTMRAEHIDESEDDWRAVAASA